MAVEHEADREDQYLITEQVLELLEPRAGQIMDISPLHRDAVDMRESFTERGTPFITGFLIHSEEGPVYRVHIQDVRNT